MTLFHGTRYKHEVHHHQNCPLYEKCTPLSTRSAPPLGENVARDDGWRWEAMWKCLEAYGAIEAKPKSPFCHSLVLCSTCHTLVTLIKWNKLLQSSVNNQNDQYRLFLCPKWSSDYPNGPRSSDYPNGPRDAKSTRIHYQYTTNQPVIAFVNNFHLL